MSHHEAPSTPYQQHENYSPISTTVSPVSQRFHTPKRRRVGSGSMPDFDPAAPSFVPGQDLFDFSFPPALDLGHHSPPPVNQNHGPFSSNWDIGFRYDDLQSFGVPPDQPEIQRRPSQPLVTRPDFSSFLQYSSEPPRLHREPVDFHGWPISRIGAPPGFPPYIRQQFQHPLPTEPPRQYELPRHSVPQFISTPPGLGFSPPHRAAVQVQPPQAVPVPATSIRRRGAIILSLSRATDASIEELPEHKRECPACQLEFEPDNYMAVISCCGTAMHAVCLSAWVNSQTYSKTKVCMKCRKAIDARRALNNVVPPVTDKSWDAGVEFDAPPHVFGDNKTEIDISGRNDAMYRRIANMRRDPSYRRRVSILAEHEVPAEHLQAYHEMQLDMHKESEAVKTRYRTGRSEWRLAFDAEARAGQTVVEAKDALQAGLGMTQREVNGLLERHRETKEIQEHRHNAYRVAQVEWERLVARHEVRVREFRDRFITNS